MGVAAAIIGGAALSGVAAIGGSLIQSSAAQKASSQQVQQEQQALQIQQQQFKTGQTAVQPFITAGQSVLPTLTSLQNPGTAASTIATLPGFQFASDWGTKTTQNALAAEGLGGSTGPLAKGISDYNNGLASTQYGNYIAQLQATAGLGSGAASSLLSGAINSGNSQASTLGQIGTAQASGTLGSANALAGGATTASSALSNALLTNAVFGNTANSPNGTTSIYGSGAAPYGQNPSWFTSAT